MSRTPYSPLLSAERKKRGRVSSLSSLSLGPSLTADRRRRGFNSRPERRFFFFFFCIWREGGAGLWGRRSHQGREEKGRTTTPTEPKSFHLLNFLHHHLLFFLSIMKGSPCVIPLPCREEKKRGQKERAVGRVRLSLSAHGKKKEEF